MIDFKKIFFILFFFISVSYIFIDYFILETSIYKNFYATPVLNDGRVKPIGVLKSFVKFNINNEKDLADLIFSPSNIYFSNRILIDKNTCINLGLPNKKYFYLLEILNSLKKNSELLSFITQLNKNSLTFEQKNILDLYYEINALFNLGESLSFISFDINDASKKAESKYTLMLTDGSESIKIKDEDSLVKFIPTNNENWSTLYSFFKMNNYIKLKELDILSNIYYYYSINDLVSWNKEISYFNELISNKLSYKSNLLVKIEVLYSQLKLINKSCVFYFLCFFLLIFFKEKNLFFRKISLSSLSIAVLLNFLDIILRILITGKAPVTSLYESVVFVNFIFSLFFLILYLKKSIQYNFFLVSVSISFLLNIISIKLGYPGLKSIIAVLNTNFWLTIHVITMSIGYGLCLINGCLCHVYLYLYTCGKNENKFNKLYKLIFNLTLLSLFFSFIGTLMGGVWADQSWGRFWGWDPKENGALLIVLWLTFILHAKSYNFVSEVSFVAGGIINTVVLFLAWFGVNLLNTGLHSYGFIENIGKFLCIFIFIEFLFIFYFYLYKFVYKSKSTFLKNQNFLEG